MKKKSLVYRVFSIAGRGFSKNLNVRVKRTFVSIKSADRLLRHYAVNISIVFQNNILMHREHFIRFLKGAELLLVTEQQTAHLMNIYEGGLQNGLLTKK